ncbi:LuxR C-terminal-related transcriptional regulator [Tropicimonas marinistellae]|uniref:LuxR C-terminal-related transcriptional regulator n=1 Tax=Tropicimonas marinistellae TaxID=1739787 RepID=UPI00082B74F4|nr:LuxR C-terminal-related transcriptional regulator [Tropicimonas marinistellae]
MSEQETEEEEILAVMRAEAQAFLDGDIDALASHWVQTEDTARMVAWAQVGTKVIRGWEDVLAQAKAGFERHPPSGPRRLEDCLRWENFTVVIGTDMAWVLYDQTGMSNDQKFRISGLQHELKIFHRVDGQWKIACMALLKPGFEHVDTPRIQVNTEGRVVWMNSGARSRMQEQTGLVIAAGKLRARKRSYDAKLQKALSRVARALETQVDPRSEIYESLPVGLGESDDGILLYCWVFPEDGRIFVSFDDQMRTNKRLDMAEAIYGLSPAQCRLAHLLIEGHELSAAADSLDVSINTVRTQLQRMFDKTGVRKIQSLVRVLLSVDAPS